MNINKPRKIFKKRLLILERNSLRPKVINNIKLFLNMVHYFLDYYVINSFRFNEIQNDLGASFTTITRHNNTLIKRADAAGEAKLIDEILWIKRFENTGLAGNLPTIHRFSVEPGSVFYEMRYYNYPNLRRIILSQMNASFFIRMRLRYLLEIMHTFLWIPENSIPAPDDFVIAEHLNKYDKRFSMLLEKAPWFSRFLESATIMVNGEALLNAHTIIQSIRGNDSIMASLKPERVCIAHGDIHSNNILCGIAWSNMILLDCRGKSNSGTPYFDPAYDIAKLFHDFRSLYSLIELHRYSLFHFPDTGTGGSVATPSLEFKFLDKEAQERFGTYYRYIRDIVSKDFVEYGNLIERAEFIEAMLFLTMIPLHLRLKDEAIACYLTGVRRLNEWLGTYHPEHLKTLISSVGLPEEQA
ncbi:MAG TPA: hypothetical protein VMX33_02435 [bacterium]|nr:hypothetical protein [bacterium]